MSTRARSPSVGGLGTLAMFQEALDLWTWQAPRPYTKEEGQETISTWLPRFRWAPFCVCDLFTRFIPWYPPPPSFCGDSSPELQCASETVTDGALALLMSLILAWLGGSASQRKKWHVVAVVVVPRVREKVTGRKFNFQGLLSLLLCLNRFW
jgi:hypothetical protein